MEKFNISMIASPGGNAAQSPFVNESINSMNTSFFLPRITQNEDSFMSPAAQSPTTTAGMAELGISAKAIETIRAHVMQDMQANFKTQAVQFFQEFEGRIEDYVDLKFNGSSYKEHIQGCKSKQETKIQLFEDKLKMFDDHYEDFMHKFNKLDLVHDKIETKNETLSDQLQSVKADISELDRHLKDLQVNTDEELAKFVQTPLHTASPETLESRLCGLEQNVHLIEQNVHLNKTLNEQLTVQVDGIEQYNRQYIVNFEKIVGQGTRKKTEQTTNLIINFVRVHLGIHISNKDISICHRQDIPSERMRLGRKFIAPIYCKFLHRSLVHRILERKHLLKHTRNKFNEPYEIKQNLTLNRRLLWSSVEEKLSHFRFKWVKKGGDICVKEHANSKVIKVISERVLDELLAKHPAPKSTPQASNEPSWKNQNNAPSTNRGSNTVNRFAEANRYAPVNRSDAFSNIANHSFSSRRIAPHFIPSFSRFQHNNANLPLSTFRNTSFVNYQSSAY